MVARYFGSRYFAAGYFGGAPAGLFGGYYGAGYFGANYFRAGFYGPITITSGITASLDITEAADTLESTATVAVVEEVDQGFGGPRHRVIRPRLEPIVAALDIRERPDTCEATVMLGLNPVAMDNDLLLLAAA